MPTKISNFPTSSTPALNDLIPIIDVSETNVIKFEWWESLFTN